MTATPQDAATLVLMRDHIGTGTTPEVLLVQHRPAATGAAGAYGFPGGLLEPTDALPPALALSREFTAAEAMLRLPDVEPASRALSFWIAALRVTFDQAGILLARYGDGRLWEPDRHDLRILGQQRQAMRQGGTNFPNLMHDLERALATDLLVYFAHGMTPDLGTPRFSTRFFLARLPSGVAALPAQDAGSTPLWVTPADALQRHADGALDILAGTTKILQLLRPFPSAAAAMAHFREQPVETVSP
jgi:recombination protein RecT